MDITITDTDGASYSPSDANLVRYLATSDQHSSSTTHPLSWRAADSYEFGQLFNPPSNLDMSWSAEMDGRYITADHSLVSGDLEYPLSDHSYSTATRSDSGSHPSSHSYNHTPSGLPHDTQLGFVGASEPQWPSSSDPYSTHGQEIHLPPLQTVDPAGPSLYLPDIHPSASDYLPPLTSLSQVSYHTPAPFSSSTSQYHTTSGEYHTPPSTFLAVPSHESFDNHHFLAPSVHSTTPSPHSSTEERHRYISIAQLTGSDVPDVGKKLHSDHLSGSPHNRGRGRGRGRGASQSTRRGRGRRAGRGGQHIPPAVLPSSQIAAPTASPSRLKRRRPSYTSSSSSNNNTTPSSDSHDQGGSALLPPKRVRQIQNGNGKAKVVASRIWSEDEAEYGDDGDEYVYVPSRSASPDQASASDYSDSGSLKSPYKRRVVLKGKDRMPIISAAEALAQVAARHSNGNDMGIGNGHGSGNGIGEETGRDGNGEWQPLPLYTSVRGASTSTSRGRKNGTISLPVPVPHLTKKSRGRKVPYVDVRTARGVSAGPSASAGREDDDSDGTADREHTVRGASSRRGRGGRGSAGGNGGRSFVCQVPGCGKCFVRGEHLKRHVRSIHTNEKPHPCPYEGCNKSFSRRDNLGQHVRLHMMGSG